MDIIQKQFIISASLERFYEISIRLIQLASGNSIEIMIIHGKKLQANLRDSKEHL